MRDLLTTRNQNCWKEIIDKETLTRMTWKLNYNKEHPNEPKMQQTTRKKRAFFIPQPVTTLPPLIKTPQPLVSRVDEPDHDLNLSEMKPVNLHSSKVLYDGFTKEGKGRYLYLKNRKQYGPEEKYPHPLLSSWEYGWRLGDVVKEFKTPIHGRSRIVKDTFYSKNGVISIPKDTDKML